MESQRNSKIPKFNSLDGVISPINVPNFVGGRRFHHSPMSPIFDPYASDNSHSPSPLIKYLRSAVPLIGATVPSSPVFTTPMKVEEDVLVMDGIPVSKSSRGGRMRVKSATTLLNLNSNSNSNSSSSSGGGVNENSISYPAEICRNWEDCGIFRFGSKCQFGLKEEQRPPRFSGKTKLEVRKIFKLSKSSWGSGSSHGRKCCSVNQIEAGATATISLPTPPTPMPTSTSTSTPLEIERNPESIVNTTTPKPALLCSDWTPQNDGIEITLPSASTKGKNPSKQDVDAYIRKVLYGTGSPRRLPVFIDICKD